MKWLIQNLVFIVVVAAVMITVLMLNNLYATLAAIPIIIIAIVLMKMPETLMMITVIVGTIALAFLFPLGAIALIAATIFAEILKRPVSWLQKRVDKRFLEGVM